MKIKVKITPAHYTELINVVERLPYDTIPISNVELINLKYFWREGKPKCTDFILKRVKMYTAKTMSIDINHFEALKNALSLSGVKVSQYALSIVETIKTDAQRQINREVSAYRLVG